MDHSFPSETLPLTPSLAALAARIAGFIGAGGRAVVLLGPPGAGKTAILETVLATLPGRQTRLANPGLAPLTMKRMLRQMGAPSDAMTSGHFFRTLAEQAYDDESATVAVDDAHSLSPYALASLARIPGLGGPELPGMILFLVGESPLLGKLSAPGLELLRNSRRALVLTLPDTVTARAAPETASAARLMWTTLAPEEPASATDAPAPAPAEPQPELLIMSRTGPKAWQPALAGAVLVAALVMTALWPSRVGEAPPTMVGPPVAEASTAAPAAPSLQAAAETPVPSPPQTALQTVPQVAPQTAPQMAPQTAAQTAPQTAPQPLAAPDTSVEAFAEPTVPLAAKTAELPEVQLRREFDGFLDRAGRDTAKLTPPAREALFREYLTWRARSAAAAP